MHLTWLGMSHPEFAKTHAKLEQLVAQQSASIQALRDHPALSLRLTVGRLAPASPAGVAFGVPSFRPLVPFLRWYDPYFSTGL